MGLYMGNILELQQDIFYCLIMPKKKMRKKVQIGMKSKKIDQYVALFVKLSSNKLYTLPGGQNGPMSITLQQNGPTC